MVHKSTGTSAPELITSQSLLSLGDLVEYPLLMAQSSLSLLEHDGLVLGLARPPEEEGDPQGGQGHHSKGSPVELEGVVNLHLQDGVKWLF